MKPSPSTILITGVETTITHHTALALAGRGHHVIATAKTAEALDSLKKVAEAKGLVLEYEVLDVTDRSQADALAAAYTIDILFNGAFTGQTGPIVETPMDRIRSDYETNVFGTLNVIQAFTPQMIQRKNGRVIFLSSMIGLSLPMFFNSYAGTKLAVESIAGSMRNELKYFNVDVVMLNPGRIDDGDTATIAATKYTWIKEDSPYFALIEEMKRHDEVLLGNAGSVASVVKTAVRAVEDTKPRLRYTSPWKYAISLFLLRLMPTRMQDWSFFISSRMKTFK